MKKLISTLMIGIVTTTCAMTTMAAPSFEHNRQDTHRFDKKSMPHVSNLNQHQFANAHDRRDMNRFDDRDHRGFFNKNDRHNDRFDRKAPPMQPKHR